MSMMKQRRFPLAPLMVLAGVSTASELGLMCGVSRDVVNMWSYRGGVTAKYGDRLATMLDLHPVVVWPDYYDDIDICDDELQVV